MPKIDNQQQRTLTIIVLTIGVIALIVGTFQSPPHLDQTVPLVSLVLIVAALQLLPLKLFSRNLSFIHLILFSAGIIYGSGFVSWGTTLGITASLGILFLNKLRVNNHANGFSSILSEGFFSFGLNTFTLVLTLAIFGLGSGISSRSFELASDWQSILGAGLFFGILHGGLFAFSNFVETQNGLRNLNWDLLTLISIETLPVFFGFISLLIFPFLCGGTLIIIGAAVFAITLMVYYLSAPRNILERRLQELSALEQISRILSAEIDLDNLLDSIQAQVTDLLNVDNFYVALLDPIDQHIWYPLAVKNGERQNWQRRALTDRLTDRVLREGKPILIPSEGGKQLSAIGLPVGENAPCAWIGVPLITSKNTIGCLALFSMSPEAKFTEDDLNLLTILSGQTSVAIEIALHNALLSSDITIGRDRLTTILNSIQEGLILFDTDNKISMVNEAVTVITGIPQSDFIGHTYAGLTRELRDAIGFTPEDMKSQLHQITEEDSKIFEKSVYKLKKSTAELFVERSLIQVLDEGKKYSGTIITLRNVTEEIQLKQTQELISETLVHDLRSPLSSTISALDVISDAHASGDPAGILDPSIQIAMRSSKRLLSMVESIMEINRMESGKLDLSRTNFELEELIKESISEHKILAEEYQVGIIFEPGENSHIVKMDEEKIQRVISNLVDNALKFSPEGEDILIELDNSDLDVISIHVLDRGPGVPADYADSIFDRFFQIPNHSSRKRGTGLGLTYCRLAVDAHGGRIWVENRTGGGSNFTVELPSGEQK